MNDLQLIVRSIAYYWRTNLAVLLGVVVGTAVIGGALVVGDSVRESLRRMSLDRLGEIDHVLHSSRFFREELADELQENPKFRERYSVAAPALVMQGALNYQQGEATSRAGKVQVYGLDERLWDLTLHDDLPPPQGDEIILNSRTARQLGVKQGDAVSLFVELPSSIPRDSLLGKRDETAREIALSVKAVLEEDSKVGRLALTPNQQLPLNAFVSLETLQENLDLAEVAASTRRQRAAAPARINSLFVQAIAPIDGRGLSAEDAADRLTQLVAEQTQLEDVGLRIVKNQERDYLSLESEQQILEEALAEAGRQGAERLQLRQSPVLVYLANEIINAERPEKFSMYSIIAGVDYSTLAEKPFGPLSADLIAEMSIGPDEMILTDWLLEDLALQLNEKVIVKYHLVGSHGELPEEERRFLISGVVRLDNSPLADRGLTPEVKGITDAESFSDWDQPFEMRLDRVTDRDEDYWDQYRATPKAFVSLATAEEMWRSKYGKLTSLRVSKVAGKSLDESADLFAGAIRGSLQPERIGLFFLPIKYRGLAAASGTTPFSVLFISFSFFLILSSTILIGLLFRLGIERRGASIGLFSAVGFSPRAVRRIFLREGLIVVGLGGLLGVAAAVGYAELMVYGLKTWWFGAIGTRLLNVYPTAASLASGLAISVGATMAVIWWALRQSAAISARDLLSGLTEQPLSVASQQRRSRTSLKISLAFLLIGVVLVIGVVFEFVPVGVEAIPGFSLGMVLFFLVGISLLVSCLTFLAGWLDSDRSAAVRGAGLAGVGRLGMRNAARHRQRSVLTVGLIASATFVIVAVAAGRRNPAVETPEKNSGNGGFSLVAETSTPILHDFNTPAGRNKLNLVFAADSTEAADRRKTALLEAMQVMPFRVKPGEESSCLNIYQTQLPRILGVPQSMIDRGGFKFSGTKVANPWTLLNEGQAEAVLENGKAVPVYPVLGDMNTLQYSLHKGVGETIAVPDEKNPEFKLKIVGMFDGSVFQGVLLMSEHNFQTAFPRQRAGYEYFLVDVPLADAGELSSLLETRLTEYGFDTERVADRLADFLAVQNTYLLTFQTLGGLGLLLGTFGLATVMLRNVLERRSELALLRAVGFRNNSLAWLVLWENAFLLFWGLVAGTISALLAMTPHLMSTGADVPWREGGLLLVGVFLVGTLAALFAVVEAVRTPILASLRSE